MSDFITALGLLFVIEGLLLFTSPKKIFNVGRDLSSAGGTGTDVLRKVPSVDVDIDDISQ